MKSKRRRKTNARKKRSFVFTSSGAALYHDSYNTFYDIIATARDIEAQAEIILDEFVNRKDKQSRPAFAAILDIVRAL